MNEIIAQRILAMCRSRNWSLHWTARGAYLHLESSELIESLRGKGGDPVEEAADVLIVLASITAANGILWDDVSAALFRKLQKLETVGPYKGEERMDEKGTASP